MSAKCEKRRQVYEAEGGVRGRSNACLFGSGKIGVAYLLRDLASDRCDPKAIFSMKYSRVVARKSTHGSVVQPAALIHTDDIICTLTSA